MARWGLRWVFCWLSVLVTACAQLASPTPAEKTQNRTPLQGFTPPPTASPTEPVRPAYTLTPLGQTIATQSTKHDPKLDVALGDTVCYESLVQSLVCLGWVENTSDRPVKNVLIDVSLLNLQGYPLATVTVTPPLIVLFPQSGSPYRAVFDQLPTTDWAVYAELRHAEAVDLPQQIPLPVQGIQSEWVGVAYQVSGVVVNGTDVEQIRVVTTILGETGAITGFRVLDFLALPSSSLAFEVVVAPLDRRPGQSVLVMAQGTLDS